MSRREFQFSEGGSQKFWAIDVDGPRFTVQFGRIGTAGQTQTKKFKSEVEAQKAADKLIAEKTKKGYAEVGAAAAPATPAKAAKPNKAAAPAPSKAPAAAAPLEVTHAIDLDPTDWYLAPWRKLPPLPPPKTGAAFRNSAPAGSGFRDELGRRGIDAPDERVIDLLLDEAAMNVSWETALKGLEWFLKSVLPYMPAEAWAARRDALRTGLKKTKWPSTRSERPSWVFHLAGFAGLHDELLALVSSWPDDAYSRDQWGDYRQQTQVLLFGLGSAELVSTHIRRMRLTLRTPELGRGWLAHTELTGLDYLRDCVTGAWSRKDAEKLVPVFNLVRAPEAAPNVLALWLDSPVRSAAAEWLAANPANAIAGLVPVTAGQDKLAEAAVNFLRDAKKKGHAALIEEQLKGAPAAAADKVREAVLAHEEKVYEPLDPQKAPKPLRDALAKSSAPAALPSWADPSVLLPLLVGGKSLDAGAGPRC
jgi:predicted DNA-binding WGR domain protein